ncbi:MAG: HAD family hydrolase [Planctomycetota bacterium]|nr:HAD family hydrolase [Planctomycetota bacterium]
MTDNKMRSAIFLDRDGTLIEDRGNLSSTAEVVFFPETVESLRRLQQDYLLFIVSNQSGVGEGLLTVSDVERVNDFVVEQLAAAGVAIMEVYWCPHQRSDDCECIKPKPYFLRQASKHHGVDLSTSVVIGDHPHDVYFADNVGAKGIYVLTGHGRRHCRDLTGDFLVVAGIAEATEWIMSRRGATAVRTGAGETSIPARKRPPIP